MVERTDSNVTRKKLTGSLPRLRRQLKRDTVPSVFPNTPTYLSSTKYKHRTTATATARSRREKEASRMEALEQSFIASDDISCLSLSEVTDKL